MERRAGPLCALAGALLIALLAACNASHRAAGGVAGAAANAGASGEAAGRSDSSAGDAAGDDTDAAVPAGGGRDAAARAGSGGAGAGGTGTGGAGAGGQGDVCSEPWFKCRGVCPEALILSGGGRSFGECTGDCGLELSLGASIVLDDGRCAGYGGSLEVSNTSGSDRRMLFSLTDAAWEQATSIALALADATGDLVPVTGCPDCADGGEAWIAARVDGFEPDRFRYEHGQPPDALRAADAFVQALIDQALACSGEWLAVCNTWDLQRDLPIEPQCGTEPLSTETCRCAADLERIDGMACDGSCGMCLIPVDCGANCITPCAGGGPVWSRWCSTE